MPEHLQRFMEEYNRQQAAQSQHVVARILRSKYAILVGLAIAGVVTYTIYEIDDVSSEVYFASGPALRQLAPDRLHRWWLWLAKVDMLPKDYDKDDPYMIVEPENLFKFSNPVGLAAGFDVCAVGINGLLKLGFGFIEAGVLDASKPADEEESVAAVAYRLRRLDRTGQLTHLGRVGVAVRGTRDQILCAVSLLGPHVDYLAVQLEQETDASLPASARAVVKAAESMLTCPKVFLRHPAKQGSSQVLSRKAVASAALASGAAGVVLYSNGAAGARGQAATTVAEAVKEVFLETDGRIVIIAGGGVESGREALECIENGASVVQLSRPALLHEGPQLPRRVKNELSQLMMVEGHVDLPEVVGMLHRPGKGRRRKNPWGRKRLVGAPDS